MLGWIPSKKKLGWKDTIVKDYIKDINATRVVMFKQPFKTNLVTIFFLFSLVKNNREKKKNKNIMWV